MTTHNRDAWLTPDGRIEVSFPMNDGADVRLILTVDQADQCITDLTSAVVDQSQHASDG